MGRKNKRITRRGPNKKNEGEEGKEFETERERVRRKRRKKALFSTFLALVVLAVIGGLGYILVEKVMDYLATTTEEKSNEQKSLDLEVEIINENKELVVSSRTREYIKMLEEDLKDLDLKLLRVIIPKEKIREIDVDIEGVKPFFKVNVDRDSAVTAEDISRMIRYLNDNGLIENVMYVDVRVEGKAFYK